MDLTYLLTLPEHDDGDTCKLEIRTVALWSHLRIKITNVKAKQLLLLFTASAEALPQAHSLPASPCVVHPPGWMENLPGERQGRVSSLF